MAASSPCRQKSPAWLNRLVPRRFSLRNLARIGLSELNRLRLISVEDDLAWNTEPSHCRGARSRAEADHGLDRAFDQLGRDCVRTEIVTSSGTASSSIRERTSRSRSVRRGNHPDLLVNQLDEQVEHVDARRA